MDLLVWASGSAQRSQWSKEREGFREQIRGRRFLKLQVNQSSRKRLVKRPVGIVAVVAVYTVVQIVVMMSTTCPVLWQIMHPNYREAVWIAELALIPALAAFFSFLIYGRGGLGKRALRIYLVCASAAPIVLIPFFIAVGTMMLLDSGVNSRGPTKAEGAIMFVLVLIMWALIGVVIFRLARRIRNQTVELEEERWLKERNTLTAAEIRRRNRAIRIALWIPSACVLLVFLLFPEMWGLSSRVAGPRVDVPGYRVSLPVTWFVSYSEVPDIGRQIPSIDRGSELGSSWIEGFMVRGVTRAPASFFRDAQVSMSSWEIGSVAYGKRVRQRPPADFHILSQRQFSTGKETLTCYDYRLFRNEQRFGSDDPTVHIDCYGTGRLYASFFGERTQVDEFYHMLQGIRPE
jgi:hypothetical protein